MATDSTNLPQGETTTLDAGIDMTGSDLDLTSVQVAQTEPANYVDLPKGNTVILLPVQPGQTVKLPTDTTSGLLAKIGPEGNLAIVVDGRTIILQGYLKAHDQSPIKVVTNDGDTVDVVDLVANTDSSLDIQTAAGPASGNQGDGADGSGIYIPFLAGPGLGGILAEGILDPTALQYRLIDNTFDIFEIEEDGGPTDIEITFDILGGVVNEDDLLADDDSIPDNFQALLVVKDVGNDGTGNDPFDDDSSVIDGPQNDKAGNDATDGVPDSDREPLTAQAFVKVTFGEDIPGTLWVDLSVDPANKTPTGLTSEGEPIIYQVLPPSATQGNGIVAFVDGNGNGKFDDEVTDRRVFEIKVNEKSSDSEFTIDFTLYDNIDNVVPDKNDDGRADLLNGVEEVLGLPVKVTAKDSDGTPLSTVMQLGVQDDIPFFGEVHVSEGEGGGIEITIDQRDADITHDETKDVDDGSDDQLEGDAQPWVQDAEDKVINAGFGLPEGDSKGALDPIGVAQTQVMASFGADQATQEHTKKWEDPEARNSIFGELQDRETQDDGVNDGENERPFELFMTVAGTGGAPAEDDLDTVAVEGNLTIADQLTNATVTWDGGDILNVYIRQIDAQTIIGYVIPEGEPLPPAREVEGIDSENGEQAVFVLTIDDNGVMTFVQYHQLNHPESPDEHDEKFEIADVNGDPLIHVRISDYDGDHAQQPVHLVVEDDGPKFEDVCFDHGNGTVDEDYLGKVLNPGNFDLDNILGGGNGDDQILDGTSTSGTINFSIGADKPGTLSIGSLVITDSDGQIVDITALKTADGNGVTLTKSGPDGEGVVTWQGVENPGGAPVFTMTLDTAAGDMGAFKFTLNQALQHPYTDSDLNNDDNPDSAFEDNFNFAFNVVATDIDKDTAQGTINISVDDDSPTANDDHDEVTEGKDKGGNLNFASGNVVTGGDAAFLGKDSNVTFPLFLQFNDGTPDLPGADRPYTISKLEHDGNIYELSADGLTVTGLTDGDSYDALTGVLKITTEEGGTFEIVMTSATPSLVGEYKYTVPVNADHDHDKHAGPADLATSTTGAFDTVLEWETSFAAAGITLEPFNGALALKVLSISGPNYRGIGVGGGGDETEVDNNGADQTLTLKIANPTDNIALTIGALYSGGPDGGFQEILLWQVFDGATLVASGQILGSETGLVPLDIDTNGDSFDRVVLTPINNGAGESANNSDFVLVNAEICCPEDKFVEQFDYTLRDSDGDEDTASLCIDVKDTKPKFNNERDATVTFLVDEDGISGGLKNASPQDDAETPGGTNVDNDGTFKGKINFTPGADTVTIELSVGDPSQPGNGDTGLDTVDGKNVFAAWDPSTSTLVGYIEGTDPSETANRVFTAKVDNHQTGEFTFTLLKPVEHPDTDQSGDNNENNPNLSFTINFQIEDTDCDTIYGEMIVKIDDDMPVITQQSGSFSLIVDESLDGNTTPNNAGDHPHDPGDRIEDDEDGAGLPAALTNIASLPGVGDVIGAAKTSGSSLFTFQPGADGLQSAVYSLTLGGVGPVATNLIDTLSGLAISLQGGFADGTVRGLTSAGDIVFAFSINAGTGEVSMAQYRAINHGAEEAAPGNHDEEKSLGAPASPTAPVLTNLLSVTLTVTDKDNDTVSSTVDITGKVKFEDDGPHAKIDKKHDNEVTHDESAGLQNDDQGGKLPAVFPAGALGWAHSDDPIVTTSGTEYGQDGAGTTVLSLDIAADGTNSGLDDTATGKDILLYQSGDIVLGKVAGSGELVFAVSINQDGTIDVAQYRAIEHPDDDDHDEDVGISHDALQAVITITDKDGDSDTDSVSIGSRIRFDDDGPKADININHEAAITIDESKDAAAGDGFPDGNANDEVGNVGGDIGYGTILGKALFIDNSVYGTDGPGTKAYSLVVSNGTSSGLFDSETNANIRLYQVDATTIEGRPDVAGVDPVSFTITIDPLTGNVTVSQFRAVEHDNPGSSASDHDESGSPEIMDQNKLFVRQTIVDGDKDHDTDDIDLGKIIRFEDDGPIARNDVDSLDPAAGNTFESQGNVITGAAVTTPGIDEGGTDVPWVISNLVGSKTSDSNSSGGFNVTGTYGSLSMNTSGQYTYNFDETNSGKVPSGSTEVFTYTLKDSDGDTDTATLTIKLGEATVDTSAVVNNGAGGCIPEDTFGPLTLKADPGTGDRVTQIVLSNVPAGWDIKDDSNADFVIVGGTISGAPVFAGGQITFNITGAAPGADVTITVQVKGAPDSDVNGTGLVVGATVVDGVVFANDTTPFDVSIDAVADGDDKGDDGDANKLGVTIDVTEGGDANSTFQVGETGNVKVTASYDDFKDGSETHTLSVQAPTGFTFGVLGVLPAGVVLDAGLSDADTLVFKVDSKDGDGQAGVGSFELNIPVVYGGGQPNGNSGNFSATVTTTETPTELECNYDNNTDSATATDVIGIATPPQVRIDVGLLQGGECIFEDTQATFAVNAATDSASHLTSVVLTGLPAGWAYDFSGLDTDGAGTDVTVDTSVAGQVTVTFSPLFTESYNGTFKATPPADSDVDFGTLTGTVNAANDIDAGLVASTSDNQYFETDAVADGKGAGFGDDGDGNVLSVSISVDDSVDGDPTFAANEIGTVKIGATFDDFKDGSEVHTVTIDAPAGFKFLSVEALSLPAGVTVQSLADGQVVLLVDSSDAAAPAGVGSFSDVLINVQNVSAPSGTTVNFTATAKAVETNLSGEECTTGNNEQSVSATDDATTFTNQIPIAYDDKKCGDEAGPKNVNLLLVFDNSGSMGADSGIPGATKLEAAKQAAINLLNAYAATGGDVRVMLVTFNSDSDREGTWLNLADAIDAIDNIPQSGGATNYEAAIQDAISGFNDTDGRGDFATHDNFVYFLSDGEPTTGGNPGDNSITDGTLANWDGLLENPANQIDHVYAVGLGTGISGGASNPNLLDVANPANDATNETPNTVVLVDDFNDLSATLTGTIGSLNEGNVLDGSIENDPDAPGPNVPDFQGDGPAHVSYLEYDHPSLNDLDIKVTWDGVNPLVVDGTANGANLIVNGTKVSFDTEHGRMTFDFSNGDYDFLAGAIDGGDKEEHFTYKITDDNGDQSNPADLTVCIKDVFVDKTPITYDDVASGAEPAPKSVNLLLVFDNSGSMNADAGIGGGVTKLQAAKQAAINMLNAYATTGGDVRVMLVTFNSNSDREETWLNLADAIIAINGIPQSGGATNYEAAILDAISGFNDTDGRGDFGTHDNFVYFLSDGEPTTGGNPGDNSITDGTLASWDSLLENPANQIDHVYAVGLGTGISGGASNPNLLDVANPANDATNETPNTVVLVDDFNDLSATLTGTIGTPIVGNILNGANESDLDGPNAGPGNDADNPGDAPAHLSHFEYDSADNDLDIKITWDGSGAVVVDGTANGKALNINGKEVSFDTDHGRMTIDFVDGDFKFLPENISGGNKTEVFEYKTTDVDGDVSNESTLKVTIENLALPETNAGSGSGSEDAASIAVSLSGTDDNGTVTSFRITSLPANGTLYADAGLTNVITLNETVAAAGNAATVYFVPSPNFSGTPTFQYAAIDNAALQDPSPATATITVTAVNDAPEAFAALASVNAQEQINLPLHGAAGGLSIADIDAGGNDVTVTLSVNFGSLTVVPGNTGVTVGGSPSSSVTLVGTVTEINNLLQDPVGFSGTINYNANSDTPPASATLTMTVNDGGNTGGGGALQDSVNVTINIAATNDAPTTSNANAVGNEDAASIVINLAGGDVDGSVAQFKITSVPANGKLYADAGLTNEITANETVVASLNAAQVFFVPTANYNGPASFQYAAIDNLGLADVTPATASITVNSVADPTVAGVNHIYVGTDSSVTIQAAWLLRDDSDADGPLTVTSVDDSSSKFTIDDGGLSSTFTVNFDNGEPNGSADAFTYTLNTGTVVIGGQVHLDDNDTTISGGATNDIVVGTGSNNTLNGNGGNDVLIDGEGGDTLNGGDGDDFLDGGEDGDTYTGGKGNDTIDVGDGDDTVNYTSKLDGTDIIQGFDGDAGGGGQDVLNLDLLFDSLVTATASRAALVQITDNGSTVDIKVNADGIAGFELHVATINSGDTISAGSDVILGTL